MGYKHTRGVSFTYTSTYSGYIYIYIQRHEFFKLRKYLQMFEMTKQIWEQKLTFSLPLPSFEIYVHKHYVAFFLYEDVTSQGIDAMNGDLKWIQKA